MLKGIFNFHNEMPYDLITMMVLSHKRQIALADNSEEVPELPRPPASSYQENGVPNTK